MAAPFYITTPIYYPNAEPHLGHVYTTIAADAIARYHRLKGDETFFLTGTDEHGIKMVKTAQAADLEPQALADRYSAVFRDLWAELKISNDAYIRTTDDLHKHGVTRIVEKLLANGDIYLGGYEGWYDEGQEEFVSETTAKEQEFKSAISGRPLVRYAEPSYFFRLSKYVDRILAHIEEHPHFIQPEARRAEIVSKLKQGVSDLSISRSSLQWGISMPNDPAHVVYVWIDALGNYITALGYGSEDDSNFRRYWPADVHLIGKDILWFHTVYWPAILFSLGLPAPKCIVAHGWFVAGGKKMSKTLGNFVDLERVREKITLNGLDVLRYFLLRGAPFGADPDWNESDYTKAFNELANVVGNCLNRTLNMVTRYCDGILPAAGESSDAIDAAIAAPTRALPAQLEEAYASFALQQCALLPIELARAANGYIDATAPFKLAKDPANKARLDTVLNLATQAIYRALVALVPILPEKAVAGLEQLGVSLEGKTLTALFSTPLPAGHRFGQGSPLFPKIDAK